MRVVERLHAHVIAGAEQAARPSIPDAKGEITKKVLDKDLEAKLQAALKEYNTGFGKGDKK